MINLPDALFIIDIENEINAVQEARKLGIPVIAMVDTNCRPDLVEHIIPANDDAIRTIQFILEKVTEAANDGLSIWKKKEEERKAREAAEREAEEKKREEQRKRADAIKKAKEEAEAEQKAKADAIIADLEKTKE